MSTLQKPSTLLTISRDLERSSSSTVDMSSGAASSSASGKSKRSRASAATAAATMCCVEPASAPTTIMKKRRSSSSPPASSMWRASSTNSSYAARRVRWLDSLTPSTISPTNGATARSGSVAPPAPSPPSSPSLPSPPPCPASTASMASLRLSANSAMTWRRQRSRLRRAAVAHAPRPSARAATVSSRAPATTSGLRSASRASNLYAFFCTDAAGALSSGRLPRSSMAVASAGSPSDSDMASSTKMP
mmetsp:Transcript_11335/g.47327  ORF Transcript_11335/g.47327 Transcript_11335/m.47327 type:complete len:247 (+) Transcript_11335:524-1264(+)